MQIGIYTSLWLFVLPSRSIASVLYCWYSQCSLTPQVLIGLRKTRIDAAQIIQLWPGVSCLFKSRYGLIEAIQLFNASTQVEKRKGKLYISKDLSV